MTKKPDMFEDERIETNHDFRILLRLVPFAKPYAGLFFLSLVLVFIVIALELSVPLIKKTVLDRYIVPGIESRRNPETRTGDKVRYLEIDAQDPEVRAVIERYPDLINVSEGSAEIKYSDLSAVGREDLKTIRKSDFRGIVKITVIFLIIITAGFMFSFYQVWLMEYIGQKIMHRLRMRLFDHMLGLSASYFNRNPVGRLTTRVANDIQNLNELFTSIVVYVLKDIFIIAGIMIVLLAINWKLALASFIVIPFVIKASIYFSEKARAVFRDIRIKIAEINTRFSETIEGVKIIQLFLQEMNNYKRFKTLNHENYLASMEQIRLFSIFVPVVEFLSMTAIAIVIFYGGVNVLSENMSIGVLVAFMSYMKMFFRPIRDIAEKYNIMQNAMSSAERVFMILDNQDFLPAPSPADALEPERKIKTIDRIEFQNVSLSYVPGEMILRDISFRVDSGRTIAFVGPTGAGKTSIINLIIRFYDAVEGRILINGLPITDIPVGFLRSKTAVVMQEPFLFSGTVRDNIFGRGRSVGDDEIQSVLAAANCARLVNRLPGGIDSELDIGGNALSSGERQLICIARALAKDPELIIMDEATSYIDSHTELEIREAMANLMESRTSVIIAHRLSTARHADCIYVVADGRIIESGSHEDLTNQRGVYYNLDLLNT